MGPCLTVASSTSRARRSYVSGSPASIRAWVRHGILTPVRLPSTRGTGESRRLLFDVQDLDRLINESKAAIDRYAERSAVAGGTQRLEIDSDPPEEGRGRVMLRDRFRSIAIVGTTRCPYRPAKSTGDLFCCRRHGLIQLAIIDDWLSPATRRMLAYAKWESRADGQRQIDQMYRRPAA